MPDRKKFLQEFYSKYSPETALTDERLKAIDDKYKDNDDQLIKDLYGKYAADQELGSERLDAIKTKYELKKKDPSTSTGSSPQQGGSVPGQPASSINPAVANAFDVSRKGKVLQKTIKEKNTYLTNTINEYATKRAAELTPLVKTQADAERLNVQLKSEVDNLIQEESKKANSEIGLVYDEFQKAANSQFSNPNFAKGFQENYVPDKSVDINQWRVTDSKTGKALADKFWSTLTDQLPGGMASGVAGSLTTEFDDAITTPEGRRSYGLSPWAKRDEAVKQFITKFGEERYQKDKESFKNSRIKEKEGLLDYAARQRGEAEGSLHKYPKTWEEAQSTGRIGEYISGNIGQVGGMALPTLTASLVNPTLGAYVGYGMNSTMEKGEAYEQGVSLLEQNTGLSRKELFAKDADELLRDASTKSGLTNGLLEYIGQMSAVGKLIPKSFISQLLGKISNSGLVRVPIGALTEGVTEWLQAKDTHYAAAVGSGQSEDDALNYALNQDDSEEFIAGLTGGGGVSVISNALSNQKKSPQSAPLVGKNTQPEIKSEILPDENGQLDLGLDTEKAKTSAAEKANSGPNLASTTEETEAFNAQRDAAIEKVNNGEPLTLEEADLLTKPKNDGNEETQAPEVTGIQPSSQAENLSVSPSVVQTKEGEGVVYSVEQVEKETPYRFTGIEIDGDGSSGIPTLKQNQDLEEKGLKDIGYFTLPNGKLGVFTKQNDKSSGPGISSTPEQQSYIPPAAEPSPVKVAEEKSDGGGVNQEVGEGVGGFTEATDLNKIWTDLKAKHGDKKGGAIYDAANRLVNPNKNTIVEIRSNGVVVKEGGKHIFKPFGNTDANSKKWTLYDGIDVSDQFQQKSPETSAQTTQIQPELKTGEESTTAASENKNLPTPPGEAAVGSKVEFTFAGSDRTGTIQSVTPEGKFKIKADDTGRIHTVGKDDMSKSVGFVDPTNSAAFSGNWIPNWVGERSKKTWFWLKDQLQVGGLFNNDIFRYLSDSNQNAASAMKRAELQAKNARNVIKEEYGKDVDNELIDAVFHGDIPFDALLPRTQKAIQAYRDQVSELQRLGLSNGSFNGIEDLIKRSDGTYVFRSFRIHDLPSEHKAWLEKDSEGQGVFERAVDFVREDLYRNAMSLFSRATRLRDRAKKLPDIIKKLENRKQKIRDIYQFSARVSPNTVREQSVKRDNAIAKVDAVIQSLKSRDFNQEASKLEAKANQLMSADARAEVESMIIKRTSGKPIVKGGSAGNMDLGILKKRGDIPAPIRELFGEYKDPHVNYMKTIGKLATLVYNHEFQKRVRETGLNQYLFERPVGVFKHEITPTDSNKTLTEGKSLYTTEELAYAFKHYNVQSQVSTLVSGLIKANAFASYGKTILAPATHVRNLWGAAIIAQLNGHVLSLDGSKWGASLENVANSLKSQTNEQTIAYLEDLTRRGIIGQGAVAGTMRDFVKDMGSPEGYAMKGAYMKKKILNNKLTKGLEKGYELEDDIFKIASYEGELSRYGDAYKDDLASGKMTEEQLKQKAADVVKRTNTMYHLTPKGISALRRFPLISSFPTFPYHVARLLYGTNAQMVEDLRDPKTRTIGLQRAAGQLSVIMATWALTNIMQNMAGVSDDEDEALDSFLAPWARRNQRIYLDFDRTNDKIKFIDLAYTDPTAPYKRLFTASPLDDDGNVSDEFMYNLYEFFRPFMDEDLLTRRLIDVWVNENRNLKRPVFSVEDPDKTNVAKRIFNHIYEGAEPGASKSIRNIIMAATGEKSLAGKEYSLGDELMYNSLGQKIETYDLRKQFKFSMMLISARLNDARLVKYNYPGDQPKGESQSTDAKQSVYKDAVKILKDARKLGIDKNTVQKVTIDLLNNSMASQALDEAGY